GFDLVRAHAARLDEVTVSNDTARFGVLCVAGPQARRALAQVTEADLVNDSFPWLSAQNIPVAGRLVRALRVSYVGELGWELHVGTDFQLELFSALTQAGKPFDASLFGAFAMNSMRLEKGYRAWGADLSTERTPIEAGLKHLVRLDNRNFEGRDALVAHEQRPGQMRMVLLEITEIGRA